jgi:hypothetical protein
VPTTPSISAALLIVAGLDGGAHMMLWMVPAGLVLLGTPTLAPWIC